MIGWLQRWQQFREARTLARRAIPDPLWRLTLARLPYLGRWPEAELIELRRLSTLFLAEKEFTAAGGLQLDDSMAVCIAAQACLPILRFGLAPYAAFVGIVVHPDEVLARREVIDDDGIVHQYNEVLSGEAMAGGPVMLSWRDVSQAETSDDDAYNVVIHEFAHVLDMGDGLSDGVPPMATKSARSLWLAVIEAEFSAFNTELDQGFETLIDPYGATGIDEFFAVSVEVFFVKPVAMRTRHPALYQLLADYFQQDPAAFDAA